MLETKVHTNCFGSEGVKQHYLCMYNWTFINDLQCVSL